MPAINQPAYNAKALTATSTVYTGSGVIGGFWVSSGTSVTIAINDGATNLMATTAVVPGWFPFPAGFGKDLTVTLGGTTPAVTILWAPN